MHGVRPGVALDVIVVVPATNEVITTLTEQIVIAEPAEELVIPGVGRIAGSANHRRVGRQLNAQQLDVGAGYLRRRITRLPGAYDGVFSRQHIVVSSAEQRIFAVGRVVLRTADEIVVAGSAAQAVVIFVAFDRVAVVVADEEIVVETTLDEVIAIVAAYEVPTVLAEQDVGPRTTFQVIAAQPAGDRVGALSGEDAVAVGARRFHPSQFDEAGVTVDRQGSIGVQVHLTAFDGKHADHIRQIGRSVQVLGSHGDHAAIDYSVPLDESVVAGVVGSG